MGHVPISLDEVGLDETGRHHPRDNLVITSFTSGWQKRTNVHSKRHERTTRLQT